MTCFSVAVLPVNAPLAPAGGCAGLIGNVLTGGYQAAIRGQGAFAESSRIRTSFVTQLSRALVELKCEFEHAGFAGRVQRLLAAAKEIRVLGSSVASQMGVASGGIEAYIDARGGAA